jgi:hypothetical protein
MSGIPEACGAFFGSGCSLGETTFKNEDRRFWGQNPLFAPNMLASTAGNGTA